MLFTGHFLLLAVLVLLLCRPANARNTFKQEIPKGITVETRPFAKLPSSDKKIICIVSRKGSNNIYVCTLTKIYCITPKGKVSVFLDVKKAIAMGSDRKLDTNPIHGGVRSIAFHPNFKSNGFVYISCMESRPRRGEFPYISDVRRPIRVDSVLIEFKTKRKPIGKSYRLVFRVGIPEYDNPIKQIAFSGKLLYIAHGDGSVNGQGDDGLGKILCIDPLKKSDTEPYTIPSKNPFVRSNKFQTKEIWALGFRNTHHLCFGKDGTLYAADPGDGNVEEVNIVLPGKNYGWKEREGTFIYKNSKPCKGIGKLKSNDARFKFEYPAAQFGNDNVAGGQAIAGGCPVENGSPMAGNYYYSDFPKSGLLYYSSIREMKRAKTRGPPKKLTQAQTRQACILFDNDSKPKTSPTPFDTLGDIVRSDRGLSKAERVDIRFGRGQRGELYWSSKTNGRVYLFTSSLPKGKKKN